VVGVPAKTFSRGIWRRPLLICAPVNGKGTGRAQVGMREMRRVDEGQRSRRTAVVRVTAPARTAHFRPGSGNRAVLPDWIAAAVISVWQFIHRLAIPAELQAGAWQAGTTRPNRCMLS